MHIPKIDLKAYEYTLPEDRIAKFPLKKRSDSKLLHYKNGDISHLHFYDIVGLLPADSLLVYNDTKVIPAFDISAGNRCKNRDLPSPTSSPNYCDS